MATERDKILSNAQKYVLKGQIEKAIKEYEKLLKVSTSDVRLRQKVGDLYLRIGNIEKAVSEYMKVADSYAKEDLSYRSISMYKRVVTIDPKNIEALRRIARLYLKEGLRGDARTYYQAILKIKPNDEEALNALKNIGDQQATISPQPISSPRKEYSAQVPPVNGFSSKETVITPGRAPTFKGVRPAPVGEQDFSSLGKEAEVHYDLGIAYKEMELYDYAISEFELAAADPGRRADCYIMIGECFKEKGNLDKSIECYTTAKTAAEVEGLPNEKLARIHYRLGCAYEACGMADEAIDAFSRALDLDRSMSEAYEKLEKLQSSELPRS